jgi:hypothetical protein
MLGCCGIGEGGQAETFTGVCGTGGKLGQTGRTVEAQVACMVCVKKGGGVLRGGVRTVRYAPPSPKHCHNFGG